MRARWKQVLFLAVALLAVAGCKLTPPAAMRPNRPDEFRLPPMEDARYNRPPEIPKEYMNPNKPRNPFEKDEFTPPTSMTGGGGMPGGRPGL